MYGDNDYRTTWLKTEHHAGLKNADWLWKLATANAASVHLLIQKSELNLNDEDVFPQAGIGNKARSFILRENKPCFHSAIDRTQSRTSNWFSKLVEALLQIYWCFFSHNIKIRGLPLSAITVSLHYLPTCLRSTVACNKTPITVNGSEPLKIRCHIIVAQWRPTVEQIPLQGRNMPLQAHRRTWVNCKLITAWRQNSVHPSLVQTVIRANKLSLQESNQLIGVRLLTLCFLENLGAKSQFPGGGKCPFSPPRVDAHELDDGWKLFYSGVQPAQFTQARVGIFVSPQLARCVGEWMPLTESVCMFRLKLLNRSLCLIQVYAPNSSAQCRIRGRN